MDGLLETYKSRLPEMKMMGPTRFARVLKECKQVVEKCKDPKMYHIIMLVTDGEIHDMQETIDEISEISQKNLPVSIIIVGVGHEDFSSMVRLDGDDLALKEGISDIVQFVKFNDIIAKSPAGMAEENLAAMVMEEIPTQFVNCYTKRGIKLTK